ncbi:MAG: DUF2149 domain-containing protein [Hylemonella sp.]|jgi:hypothetical protein|uniref:DUF2149 domain-containing protein n=1 Tax=Hylemonella sp. TaxID=2066020 RepID=UPI003919B0A5
MQAPGSEPQALSPARRRLRLNVLDDDDADDPILSVVNIVDVFLVIIAVLLIAVIENPLNPFSTDHTIVIRNPGQPNMSMVIKEGQELKQYQSSGQIGEGQGRKAGTAYQLQNGTMVYVPETAEGTPAAATPQR